MVYSPESEVASLTQLRGLQRGNQAAAASWAADLYNFTWDTDGEC